MVGPGEVRGRERVGGAAALGEPQSIEPARGDLASEAVDVTERLASEQIIARVEPRLAPHKGDQVWLRIQHEQEHLFSVKTGERLTA